MTSRPPPPPELSKEDLERLRKQNEQQWPNKNNVKACTRCKKPFTWWKKRCRSCGEVVCTECSKNNLSLPDKGFTKPVRVCTVCYEKIVGFPSARRGQLLSQSHGMPRIMYASTSRHGLREDNEDRICVDIKWNQDDQDDMNPRFMAFFGQTFFLSFSVLLSFFLSFSSFSSFLSSSPSSTFFPPHLYPSSDA